MNSPGKILPKTGLLATLLIAPLMMASSLTAFAQNDDSSQAPPANDLEEVISGFDDPLPENGEEGGEPADLESGFSDDLELGSGTSIEGEAGDEESIFDLGGFVRFDTSYNFAHDPPQPDEPDFQGLSKLRLALQLELSIRLGEDWDAFISGQVFQDFVFRVHGKEYYTRHLLFLNEAGKEQYFRQLLDRSEEEAEFREVYVQGTPVSSLDLKIGRQIVVWGKSDNIQVVDVLNPIDLREPGLTDLEDLRLPLTMTRLDYYFGDWGFTGIAIHEVRFNKNPSPYGDFLPPGIPPFPEVVPDHGGANTEYAAALNGIFSGWDLSLHWARLFDDDPHVEIVTTDAGLLPAFVHARITMVGAAFNIAAGSWLFKTELARFAGVKYSNAPQNDYTRADGLLGLEYSGITDTTLSFEAVDRRILNYDTVLSLGPSPQAEDINQYVLAYRGSYLREQLDLVAVFSAFGTSAEKGNLQRYSTTYELATALDLTGGVLLFDPGDGTNPLLAHAKDNDRIFLDLKWSF